MKSKIAIRLPVLACLLLSLCFASACGRNFDGDITNDDGAGTERSAREGYDNEGRDGWEDIPPVMPDVDDLIPEADEILPHGDGSDVHGDRYDGDGNGIKDSPDMDTGEYVVPGNNVAP